MDRPPTRYRRRHCAGNVVSGRRTEAVVWRLIVRGRAVIWLSESLRARKHNDPLALRWEGCVGYLWGRRESDIDSVNASSIASTADGGISSSG